MALHESGRLQGCCRLLVELELELVVELVLRLVLELGLGLVLVLGHWASDGPAATSIRGAAAAAGHEWPQRAAVPVAVASS